MRVTRLICSFYLNLIQLVKTMKSKEAECEATEVFPDGKTMFLFCFISNFSFFSLNFTCCVFLLRAVCSFSILTWRFLCCFRLFLQLLCRFGLGSSGRVDLWSRVDGSDSTSSCRLWWGRGRLSCLSWSRKVKYCWLLLIIVQFYSLFGFQIILHIFNLHRNKPERKQCRIKKRSISMKHVTVSLFDLWLEHFQWCHLDASSSSAVF